MTTATCQHIPVSLLQNGIKITKESPEGLKENLLRLYKSNPINNPNFYSGCPAKYREFTKVLYGFAFFHSVLQVRKQYGTFGWNAKYEFDETDFFVSVSQLQRLINKTGVVDFEGISTLTEANYGGKIDSEWEQMKLATILRDYFNEKVITDANYEFYATESHIYGIPRKFEHRDMVKHIEEMIPSAPSSFVYDVHPNAQIRSGIERGMVFVDDLVSTLGRIEDPVTDAKEQKLSERVRDLMETMQEPFDMNLVKERFPNDYRQCLNMNLLHECIAYNILLGRITKTLNDLQNAVSGKMVYTKQLKQIAQEITNDELPIDWQLVSYPSLKSIGSYLSDLQERVQWLKKWISEGIPRSFWLSAFFYPQSFLISCKQNYSRAMEVDLSNVRFEYQIGDFGDLKVSSVYMFGMALEGAQWDSESNCLVEQSDKRIRNEIPGIHFIPTTKKEELNIYEKIYNTPVYKTELRSDHRVRNAFSGNFVTEIQLGTNVEPSVWIKRGTAIVLQSSSE